MILLHNGVIYAQLSKPDMRHPIHDALYWPDTVNSSFEKLDFDVVIDFVTPALYLKPNRNFNTPFENIGMRRGFGYADRSQTLKGWVVRGFLEDSPAHKSGLQFGDKIIFVNGVSILEIPHEKQRDFWKSLDKVELVVLRNDEEMRFEFEMNKMALNQK
jgi:C-terminal processing protease CtpA/Prc